MMGKDLWNVLKAWHDHGMIESPATAIVHFEFVLSER